MGEMINPAITERKKRLETTQKIIEKIQPTPKAKLLGVLKTTFGVSDRTAKDYLTTLIQSEIAVVKDGLVKLQTKGGTK